MEDKELERICKLFMNLKSQVSHLFLYFDSSCDHPNDDTIQDILSIVSGQSSLKSLHLELSQMGQKGAGQKSCLELAKLLENQKQLEHLCINMHNWGSDAGYEHPNSSDLLEVIKVIPSILTLNSLSLALGGWKSWGIIRDIDVEMIAAQLMKLHPLMNLQLDLRGWGSTITNQWEQTFTDRATAHIMQFVYSQDQLKNLSLVLKGCGDTNPFFTNKSIESIGQALGKLTNLEFIRLDLAKPPSSRDFVAFYSAQSIIYLITQMKSMHNLSEIHIKLPSGCMIPKVKKVLNLVEKRVMNRSIALAVLKVMKKHNIDKSYRSEIINQTIFTILQIPE